MNRDRQHMPGCGPEHGDTGEGLSAVARRLLVLLALALPLAACQLDVFLGYGLPDNEACRDAGTLPSRPLSTDCLDSLGN
jgi:hypothetical protein